MILKNSCCILQHLVIEQKLFTMYCVQYFVHMAKYIHSGDLKATHFQLELCPSSFFFFNIFQDQVIVLLVHDIPKSPTPLLEYL